MTAPAPEIRTTAPFTDTGAATAEHPTGFKDFFFDLFYEHFGASASSDGFATAE